MSKPVSLARQMRCVERELNMRRRVYPRWVADRKLEQFEADDEIEAMQAVLDTLKKVNDQGQGQLFGE